MGEGGDKEKQRARHGKPSTSLLEQLPTELVQDVFLYSANLNLPLCSKQLLSALTSEHLKFEVTLQILVYQRMKLDEEDKNMLLTRRFFTWDFVVRYVAFAHTRVEDVIEISSSDSDDSSDSSDEDEGYAATETSTSRPPSRQSKVDSTPDLFEVDTDLTSLTQAAIEELQQDEVGHLTEIDLPRSGHLDKLTRTKSLPGLKDLQLPEKLLHNGWTDDQVRLLRLLIAFGCTVSRSSPGGIAADEGVLEAIAQEDEEIVSYFLGVHIGVEPEMDLLREAMKGSNMSIVYQILRAAHGELYTLDPQTWNLLEQHMGWQKVQKDTVRTWLQDGVGSAVLEEDSDYLPRLRETEVDEDRWSAAKLD